MSLYFQFSVFYFFSKIRQLNRTTIFGEEKMFGKLEKDVCLDTQWVENFDEIAHS